jgi:hypothetical protein
MWRKGRKNKEKSYDEGKVKERIRRMKEKKEDGG